MKQLLTCLFFAALLTCWAPAQTLGVKLPCSDAPAPPTTACAPGIPILPPGSFHATPLIDTQSSNGHWPDYGDGDHNIVSLYGAYGNTESTGAALTHYTQGTTLANSSNLTPRCKDGTIPAGNLCLDSEVAYPPALVFHFIGFSNCDIEICGGSSDIWDRVDLNPDPITNPNGHLKGQPCATACPNLNNPNSAHPWNHVDGHGDDGINQLSFLRQVYPDSNPTDWLVGPHVVVFNGALGQGTLEKWDPTQIGYYASHNGCDYNDSNSAPEECNYLRVRGQLLLNGYSEQQVQAVFIKSSNSYPRCDLKRQHCVTNPPNPPDPIADAYQAETYMGDILRYLKCCKLDVNGNPTTTPRYPNLQQVFVTSRIYGGYAKNPPQGQGDDTAGCLNPEPFAYEESFAVQRLIVAQIDRATTDWAGDVRYPESAPWVDWGPYLWADGTSQSPGAGLFWCDSTTKLNALCLNENNPGDFRYGDLSNDPLYSIYWGDHTHPTATAAKKVADQLVTFIGKTQGKPGSPFVTPWIQR